MVRTALAVDCSLNESGAIELIIELYVCPCHLEKAVFGHCQGMGEIISVFVTW